MAKEPVKENTNVYFQARKRAAMSNDRLYSRENAAELIGISPYTLADYELGNTKVVPVDKVMIMADLYNCPELRTGYCKYECPIGKHIPLATTVSGIEGIALRLIKEFNADDIRDIKKNLINVAADGVISEDEKPTLEKIISKLDEMSLAISELKLAGEKALKGR